MAECSSLCHPQEPCSISHDGKCVAWWPDRAWEEMAKVGAALTEQYEAMKKANSLPEGSPERRAAWEEWKAAVQRKRAAQAAFEAATLRPSSELGEVRKAAAASTAQEVGK